MVRPRWVARAEPHRLELQRLLHRAGVRPHDRCLEVGPGGGYLTRALLGHGARVVAADFSAPQLRQLAAVLLPRYAGRLRLRHVSLTRLDPRREGRFDHVLAVNVIHHLDDPGRGLQRLVQMLKPGGSLVVLEPNGRSPLWFLLRFIVWIAPGLTAFNWRDDRGLLRMTPAFFRHACARAGLVRVRIEPVELVPKIALAVLPAALVRAYARLEAGALATPLGGLALNQVVSGVRPGGRRRG